MNGPELAWAATGVALAAVAALLLIWRSRQGDVTCRWLAAAAVVWGAAFAAQGAGAGDITPAVIQLTLTDLLALCGLPLLVVALLWMAPAGPRGAGLIADGALLALGVFAVGWIAVLRDAYAATGVGPGFFAVDLIHPVADLVVLATAVWPAVRAGRPGLLLYGALLSGTAGDFLAVQARASGMHPGTWPQLAWLAAICLLGSVGLTGTSPTRSRLPLATGLALTAAGVGGLVTLIFSLVKWGHTGPLPLVVGGVLVLALVVRVTGLLRQAAAASARVERAASHFQQLAERTSDVVLLCDKAGVIQYASTAVAHYGYTPEHLAGTRLPTCCTPTTSPPGCRRRRTAAWRAGSGRPMGPGGTWRGACRHTCRTAVRTCCWSPAGT
jgi:hypothetical protein